MKFTVPVQTITSPILKVANICPSNPSNPDDLSKFILVEVTKEFLTLTGTDNSVQLTAKIPFPEGACEEEGSFLLEASKASSFFKSLGADDDISMELKEGEDTLQVTSDCANYVINIRRLAEDTVYPLFNIEETETAKSFKIEEKKLRYMFEKSTFCVSHDNFRLYLKGVRLEVEDDNFTLFTLDGHRMAALETKLKEPVEEEIKVSMTLRAVSELQKLLSPGTDNLIELSVSNEYISTTIGVYTLTNHLLVCQYPNVRGVLPKNCNPEISISLETLKTYVKRIAMFSNKRLNHINLTFKQNDLGIHAQNSNHEIGVAHLPIEFDSETGMEVNLNADFLKEFLNAIDTQEVVFGFSPPYSNTLIRPSLEENDMGIRIRYVVSHIMV